jgi:type VI protein secretion system component Hcp
MTYRFSTGETLIMDLKASINGGIGRRRMLRLALLLGAVALGLNCSASSRAAAAIPTVDLFLDWPGVPGEAANTGFVGQIVLLSYSQTASNSASNPNAPPRGICGQIAVTKHLDKSSPVLLGQVLSETRTPGPVTISFAKTGGGRDVTFYKVDLHDVVPVSITQSDSPSGDIVETLVFMATRFQFSFIPQNSDGTQGKPVMFGFDCKLNRKI